MKTQRLFMNVYRAGWYHRQGKPGHVNLHAGDFFASLESALEAAEPLEDFYVTTVGFDMPIPDGATILENGPGSMPTPLSETRRNPLNLAPYMSPGYTPPILRQTCAIPEATDLDAGDDVLGISYEEWRTNRLKSGMKPLPEAVDPWAAAHYQHDLAR